MVAVFLFDVDLSAFEENLIMNTIQFFDHKYHTVVGSNGRVTWNVINLPENELSLRLKCV